MSDDEQPYLKNARLFARLAHSFCGEADTETRLYDLIEGVVQDHGQIGANAVRYDLPADFRSKSGNSQWSSTLLRRMRQEWPTTLDLPQIYFPRGLRGDSTVFDIDCSMTPLAVEDINRVVPQWTILDRAVGTYKYIGASMAAHETVIRIEGLKAGDVTALIDEVEELLSGNIFDGPFRPYVQDMWALWWKASDGGRTFSGKVDLFCEVKDRKGALCTRTGSVAHSWPGWLSWSRTGRRYLLQYPNRFEYCTTPKCRAATLQDRHTLMHCPNLVCKTCSGCHLNNDCPTVIADKDTKKRRSRSKKGASAKEASTSAAPQETVVLAQASTPPQAPLAEVNDGAPSQVIDIFRRAAESFANNDSSTDMSDEGSEDAMEEEMAMSTDEGNGVEAHSLPAVSSGEAGASSATDAVWFEDRGAESSSVNEKVRQLRALGIGRAPSNAGGSAASKTASKAGGKASSKTASKAGGKAASKSRGKGKQT